MKNNYICQYLSCAFMTLSGLTTDSLAEVLPGLPQKEDKIKNSIARLFEDWWKKNLQQREAMIITTMVYLVERSLDLQPKPLVL